MAVGEERGDIAGLRARLTWCNDANEVQRCGMYLSSSKRPSSYSD